MRGRTLSSVPQSEGQPKVRPELLPLVVVAAMPATYAASERPWALGDRHPAGKALGDRPSGKKALGDRGGSGPPEGVNVSRAAAVELVAEAGHFVWAKSSE